MKTLKKSIHYLLLSGLLFVSCEKEDTEENPKDEPKSDQEDLSKLTGTGGQYDFKRNGKLTVSFSGQTTRLKQAVEINTAMSDKTTTEAKLNNMFSKGTDFTDASLNGTKNIRSKVANSYGLFKNGADNQADAIKKLMDEYLKKQVDEVFPKWETQASAGNAGYVEVGDKKRYVNAKGLEYNQALMKSLIGGLVVDQVSNHYLNRLDDNYDGTKKFREENTKGTVVEGKDYTTMEHHWDEAYGYVYGNAEKDALLYKYILKVDADEDFKGINKKIRDAFGAGREALTKKDYDKRDTQVKIIREEIAKVVAIRTIYYLKAGKKYLSEPKDAFHDLSEAYGFIYSLKFITNDGKTPIFSKTEVDGFIKKLDAENGFWDITVATLDEIIKAIDDKFDSFTADKV